MRQEPHLYGIGRRNGTHKHRQDRGREVAARHFGEGARGHATKRLLSVQPVALACGGEEGAEHAVACECVGVGVCVCV